MSAKPEDNYEPLGVALRYSLIYGTHMSVVWGKDGRPDFPLRTTDSVWVLDDDRPFILSAIFTNKPELDPDLERQRKYKLEAKMKPYLDKVRIRRGYPYLDDDQAWATGDNGLTWYTCRSLQKGG